MFLLWSLCKSSSWALNGRCASLSSSLASFAYHGASGCQNKLVVGLQTGTASSFRSRYLYSFHNSSQLVSLLRRGTMPSLNTYRFCKYDLAHHRKVNNVHFVSILLLHFTLHLLSLHLPRVQHDYRALSSSRCQCVALNLPLPSTPHPSHSSIRPSVTQFFNLCR